MQLEDYFVVLAPHDIRIKGTRVGIETILYDYIHRKHTPEEISQSYSTLTLELVYATILYYLHDPETVGKYLADCMEAVHQQRKLQEQNPHAAIVRLRKLLEEQKQNSHVQSGIS